MSMFDKTEPRTVTVQYELNSGEKAVLFPQNLVIMQLDTDDQLNLTTVAGKAIVIENGRGLFNAVRRAFGLKVPKEDEEPPKRNPDEIQPAQIVDEDGNPVEHSNLPKQVPEGEEDDSEKEKE